MFDVTLENMEITPSAYSYFLGVTDEILEKALMDEIMSELENQKDGNA